MAPARAVAAPEVLALAELPGRAIHELVEADQAASLLREHLCLLPVKLDELAAHATVE